MINLEVRAQHCVQADKGGLSPPFGGFSAFDIFYFRVLSANSRPCR
ncbi:MAG: hypothetical protein L6461_19905 [Anaerolineae bacterium]|nr:hypothetical protein [Anaerolineae bacterium]